MVIRLVACSRSNNVPSLFILTDPMSIYKNLIKTGKKKSILPASSYLTELMLKSSLNLSRHPAYHTIDLPEKYEFTNVAKFCSKMATNSLHVLHLLA